MRRFLKLKPIKERLLHRIIPEPNSGCWIWDGNDTTGPYGKMRINEKNCYVHRLSYETFKGKIPDGLLVLHKCDVPCCINPDHLFVGTQVDNMKDMRAKGRQWR